MDDWRVAHLLFLGLWGGVVFGELVLELSPRDAGDMRTVARIHFWTDLLVELPLLAMVLISGVVLARRLDHFTTLHWIKVACALAAAASNVAAAVVVVKRQRHRDDPAALARFGRWVKLSGLGVPFALVALYIGLARFR